MIEYRAIYKCRLCGEEFETTVVTSIDAVKKYIIQAFTGYNSDWTNWNEKIPLESDVHDCKNGSIGIASFLGFRKIDKEENE